MTENIYVLESVYMLSCFKKDGVDILEVEKEILRIKNEKKGHMSFTKIKRKINHLRGEEFVNYNSWKFKIYRDKNNIPYFCMFNKEGWAGI